MALDGWKVLGFCGALLFGLRWVLQAIVSRRAGRSVVPPAFWVISAAGSLVLVIYFAAGPHRDLVGLLANTLPLLTSSYNLALVLRGEHPEPRRGVDRTAAVVR